MLKLSHNIVLFPPVILDNLSSSSYWKGVKDVYTLQKLGIKTVDIIAKIYKILCAKISYIKFSKKIYYQIRP